MTESAAERAAHRQATAVAMVAAALLVAEQVAARAVRDALFLSAYRVKSLPFMMMASALAAFAGALAVSRALARRSPARVVPAAAFASALLLALLWPVAMLAPRAAAVLVYLHVAAFGGALLSGFWSLVNERFDPYTARRVVGHIGTGATAGGVAGGVVGWVAALLLPLPQSLLLLASLHALAAAALRRAGREDRTATRPASEASSGLPALSRVPYLRQLALVVTLGAIVEAIVDWSFKAEVQRQYAAGGGAALLAPLALFYSGLSVASLVLQSTTARASLEHLGIAGTVSLRPLLTGLGSLLGAASPRLWTATVARGAHEALTNSLFRSGYELLYTPVPEAEKRRVKAIIDVALDKGGALVGSWLILGVLAISPLAAERVLFAAASVLSLASLALARRPRATRPRRCRGPGDPADAGADRADRARQAAARDRGAAAENARRSARGCPRAGHGGRARLGSCRAGARPAAANHRGPALAGRDPGAPGPGRLAGAAAGRRRGAGAAARLGRAVSGRARRAAARRPQGDGPARRRAAGRRRERGRPPAHRARAAPLRDPARGGGAGRCARRCFLRAAGGGRLGAGLAARSERRRLPRARTSVRASAP
jgi:ATP/ADP translocase